MDPWDNHLHRPDCLQSIRNWNISLLPPGILDQICGKLELQTLGQLPVYKLANSLGFDTPFRWRMEDYAKKHPDESLAMNLFRKCAEENITVGQLQEGLRLINSQAEEIIPENVKHIEDFRRRSDQRKRWNNTPQQNTESFNSTSLPGAPPPARLGRCSFSSPPHDQWRQLDIPISKPTHCIVHQPQHPCNGVFYPNSRNERDFNLERGLDCPCDTCRFRDQTSNCQSAQTHVKFFPNMSDHNHKIHTYTDTGHEHASGLQSQGALGGIHECLCSQDPQGRLHLMPPQKAFDVDSHTSDTTDMANVSGKNATACQSESPNSAIAVVTPSPIECGPYPVATGGQGDILKSGRTLHICNQSSDDDSLADTAGLNRERPIGRTSCGRRKVKAVSSRRVFVTGGICKDEMRRIKEELKWLEQLGVSVDWDDPDAPDAPEAGTKKWMKFFESATVVLIGVTKNYNTNVKNREWLPRAWKINNAVQKELLCENGDNKRFRTIVFPVTGLKKVDLPPELRIAVYCFPDNREDLERSLRKKLSL